MLVTRGIWRNLKSGLPYYVEGLARPTNSPFDQIVIYRKTLNLDENSVHSEQLWANTQYGFLSEFEPLPEEDVKKLFEDSQIN